MTWQIKWVGKLPEGWTEAGLQLIAETNGVLNFKTLHEAQVYADRMNEVGSFTEGYYQPVEVKE